MHLFGVICIRSLVSVSLAAVLLVGALHVATPVLAIEVELHFADEFVGSENCAELIQEFVGLRAVGERAVAHVMPAPLLTNCGFLERFFGMCSVGSDGSQIARDFDYFSRATDLHEIAQDTVTKLAASTGTEGRRVPEVAICLLTGQCTWPFGGTSLSRAKYSVHTSEDGTEDDRSLSLHTSFHPDGPETIIVMGNSNQVSSELEARVAALQWVGLFFHEYRHHLNGKLLSRWLRASHWLASVGRNDLQDELYLTYRKETLLNEDSLESGFMVFFEESTATHVQTWISHRMALTGNPEFLRISAEERFDFEYSLLARASREPSGPVSKQFGRFRRGDYGSGILRILTEGILMNGRNEPVNESNFLSIGERLWKLVNETIRNAEAAGFSDH